MKVKYEIRDDESKKVVGHIEREFGDDDDQRRWELEQNQHPWLHLKRVEPSKAFSPEATREAVRDVIPAFVFDAVNELLAKNYSTHIVLRQDEIKKAIKDKMYLAGVSDHFDIKWLNFEPVYRDEGWKVEYDKPAYCETYEATFTFTQPRKT